MTLPRMLLGLIVSLGLLTSPAAAADRKPLVIVSGVTKTLPAGDQLITNSAAYDATTWNGSNQVPTKDAVRDKIEALIAGGGGSGSVTSVDVSGGSTGLTSSGGPVTTSGTITLTGTLDLDNGGTGATTAAGARTALGLATVASSGSAADLTGNLATARLNSGSGASSGTFWRGDGTWATVLPGAAGPSALFEDHKAANTAGGGSTSGSWISRVLNTESYDDIGLTFNASTVTMPIASPGVVNWTAHGLILNSAVVFTNTGGGLPTGITAGTTYYVVAGGLTANAFEVSGTAGGTAINFTGSSTGTHTATSSAISLAAGTYDVDASSVFFTSNVARLRIRDITNGTTLVVSDNFYGSNANGGNANPRLLGRFTLAGTALIELQYRVQIGVVTQGLGVTSNFGEDEIFSRMKLIKL